MASSETTRELFSHAHFSTGKPHACSVEQFIDCFMPNARFNPTPTARIWRQEIARLKTILRIAFYSVLPRMSGTHA
jgi:hypothetical protein